MLYTIFLKTNDLVFKFFLFSERTKRCFYFCFCSKRNNSTGAIRNGIPVILVAGATIGNREDSCDRTAAGPVKPGLLLC